MDQEPIQVTNFYSKEIKRATWVKKEVLNYRNKNGLCVRCGNKRHIALKCNLLPSIFPSTKINSVEVSEKKQKEILEMAQPDQIKENESGKDFLL